MAFFDSSNISYRLTNNKNKQSVLSFRHEAERKVDLNVLLKLVKVGKMRRFDVSNKTDKRQKYLIIRVFLPFVRANIQTF